MTDAEKINQQATENAKYDFKRINDWLQKQKERVDKWEFAKTDQFYLCSAIFVGGVLTGTKVPIFLRPVTKVLSGAALGYLGVQMFRDIFMEKPEQEKPEEAKTIEATKITTASDGSVKTEQVELPAPEPAEKKLENVKVLN